MKGWATALCSSATSEAKGSAEKPPREVGRCSYPGKGDSYKCGRNMLALTEVWDVASPPFAFLWFNSELSFPWLFLWHNSLSNKFTRNCKYLFQKETSRNCKGHEMLSQIFSWYKLTWFHCLQCSYADVRWARSCFSRLHFTLKLRIFIPVNCIVRKVVISYFFLVVRFFPKYYLNTFLACFRCS